MTAHTQSQLDALNACIVACECCSTACLQVADVQLMARCISLTRDCVDVCALTARLVARGSEHAALLLKECAQHEHRHWSRRCWPGCWGGS